MQVEPSDTVRNLRGTPQAIPPTYNRCFIALTANGEHAYGSDNGRTMCKEQAAQSMIRGNGTSILYHERGIKDVIRPRVALIRAWEERFGVPAEQQTTYAVWEPVGRRRGYNNYAQINVAPYWVTSRLAMSIFLLFLRGVHAYDDREEMPQWIQSVELGTQQDREHMSAQHVLQNLLTMWERQTVYIYPGTEAPTERGLATGTPYESFIVTFSRTYGNVGTLVADVGGVPVQNIHVQVAGRTRTVTRATQTSGVITLHVS